MTALPINRATTLKAAYQLCNIEPLEGDDLDRYYVNLSGVRKTKAIASVNTRLDFQEAESYTTILFTGHRGCGKSTELKRIQKHWEKDYRVIYLEVNEETDINDVSYTDFYLIAWRSLQRIFGRGDREYFCLKLLKLLEMMLLLELSICKGVLER
jgi:predicted AAA+ superfamily ATPase